MRTAFLVRSAIVIASLSCSSCATFDRNARADANECTQRVGAADSRSISVAVRVDDSAFTMSAVRSALAEWKDVRARCGEHWSDSDAQIATTDEARLRTKLHERCEYLSRSASHDDNEGSALDSQAIMRPAQPPDVAWQQLREECRDLWKPSFDQARVRLTDQRRKAAIARCDSSLDAAEATSVADDAGQLSVDQGIAAWNDARAACTGMWSTSSEETYQSALAKLQHRQRELKAAADVRSRERDRCGGGELNQFVFSIKFRGFDPSQATNCTLDVYFARVVNSTQDGWVIVEPKAAIRVRQPLSNGSVLSRRRLRFLGMKAFTAVNGTVDALPTFVLLEQDGAAASQH